MVKPLLLDVTRCFGWECPDKGNCYRFLTISLDDQDDKINGPRVRSYTSSMKEYGAESCNSFMGVNNDAVQS